MNLDLSCVFQGLGSHGAIYISNSKTASNFYILEKHKIRAVLTAAKGRKIDISNTKIQKYLYLEIEDNEDFDIQKYFDQAYAFIDNARKTSNILIHCHIGASRSVSIVIAYLIRKYSYSLPQIYSIIKRRRYLIEPNPGFMKQLEQYSQFYSVRNHQFTMPPPKPKLKVQRSHSFSTPVKEPNFQLGSTQRQIKSEELKLKIQRLKEGSDIFNDSNQKIEQLHKQRDQIESRLRNLRTGLIKSASLTHKKPNSVLQNNLSSNKHESMTPSTGENKNPNTIENQELPELVKKPQMYGRFGYNKQKSLKGSF